MVSEERQSERRTPGLHRIPILGWLFKERGQTTGEEELVLFVTPKIVK